MEEVEEVLGRNRLEDVSWLCSLSESELVSIWSKLPTQLFLFCIRLIVCVSASLYYYLLSYSLKVLLVLVRCVLQIQIH